MTKPRPSRAAARTGAAFVAALAAASVVFAASPALAADATDPLNWGVRTADTAQGAGRSNYAYVLDPGTSLDDAIVVSNHGDTAVDLDLYAADGFTSDSGQLDLVTRETTSTALGTWITLDEHTVHLEPRASVEVPFHVAVPANVMPGDYAGGVVTSLPTPEQREGVSVDRRLGIRVQLRVGGELEPSLTVEDVRISYDGAFSPFATGDATVTYTVRNTGNARLEGAQRVAVGGPFGLFAAEATDVSGPPARVPRSRMPRAPSPLRERSRPSCPERPGRARRPCPPSSRRDC
ncbi:WxL protein peptidoglycan domain-containing protein [Agromyces protaetiae]|nr:DUF916 domain-containing protein [Agromyces protaetiae]